MALNKQPTSGDIQAVPTDESIIEEGDTVAPSPLTVGIGASAGGHEALEKFFTTLPSDCDLSFVVVMHLPADGPSLLADLLRHHTSMQVLTVEDGLPLSSHTVHVAPPGKDLTVENGRLRLHLRQKEAGPHHPIDRFFTSLAADLGECALAIVLSGFGFDGSEGVKRIKEGGGVVLIQDPETAINPFMPQNAIATGVADAVLSAEEIADTIARFAREKGILPQQACRNAVMDKNLQTLFTLLKSRTSHDFSSYKRNTVLRRIERRIAVNGAGRFSNYLDVLAENPQEAHALCQELLIGVTSFFRDPEAFELLGNKIIPSLFDDRKTAEPVRIWHACCATGEEAYSVAMLILEYLEKEHLQPKVQIFATDLDEVAIAHARAGLYSDDIASEVGAERLERFFTRNEEHWQVTKQLREMIVFAPHNIIKDPPFSRLDLLVCRNFLIYLNPDIQKLLIPLFHQVLTPAGFLFLGLAETVGPHNDLFAPVNKKWKIFKRQGGKTRVDALFPFSGPVRKFIDIGRSAQTSEAQETATLAFADKLLMERYVPARVIINEKNEVVHFSSRAGAYLLTPEGKPTRDLLKIARKELRPALRAAIYKAFTHQKEMVYRGIKAFTDGCETTINIIVVPLKESSPGCKLALIIIEPAVASTVTPATCIQVDSGDEASRNALTRQLEEQLRVTSEQLQSTTEQLETSNERFMLANEELMTVNEELQSTNEELQSTNEELITVNSELQKKMEELNRNKSDIENLFTSSEIATLFLDRDLFIKRFSPAMAAIFNLIPADIGRPFCYFNSTIDCSDLRLDATSVQENFVPVEREVNSRKDGRSFIMRVLPYRTTEGLTDGIVVTLVDISERKRAEQALLASEKALREGDERLRFALETCHIGAWDLDLENHNIFHSLEHSRIFGYTEKLSRWTLEMFIEHILPDDRAKVEEWIQTGMITDQGWSFECRIRRNDGKIRWIWVAGQPSLNVEGGVRRLAGVIQDITERKLAEETLILSEQRRSLALEAAQAGTWEWDLQTNENLWSNELWLLYGLEPNSGESSYEEWRKIVYPDDLAKTDQVLKEAVEQRIAFTTEWRVKLKDGQLRWLMSRGRPLKNSHDKVVRYLGTVMDITERKRYEEETKILQTQLIQAQKMEAIGTLAGGIAHDFNNILGAVIGYAEMAKDAASPGSSIAHNLDKVLEASSRAANLVKQILAFSRQASTERIPLEPVHLIKEAIQLLRPALPSTITIKQKCNTETWPILADPTQIHQIVMNLCTNAFHAMEQTGGVLEIMLQDCELSPQNLPLHPEAHAGTFVVLSIRDTGPGIAPEIQDKIFEPYFTTKNIGKGTGMGLSIVHGIVSTMGGFVTCESTPGEGTVFHVFFPALKQKVTSLSTPEEAVLFGKERLLFIDDEEILTDMGKMMLEGLGYKVTVRTGSREALATFQNAPDQFDAVITDQTMPGMTGLDLAVKMLQMRPDIPIILCTGYSNLVDEEKAKANGIKGFLMKPMAKRDIARLLRKVLEEG